MQASCFIINKSIIHCLQGDRLVALSYPAGDRGVTERLAHQVSQQRVGSQEAKPDVGGLGELPQYWRVGEVHRPGPTVHQGHHDLGEVGRRTEALSATKQVGKYRHYRPGKVLQTSEEDINQIN